MPAASNAELEYLRRGEPFRGVPGKTDNAELDAYRRLEPYFVPSPTATTTQVSQSLTATWAVYGPITAPKTLSASWLLRGNFEKLVDDFNGVALDSKWDAGATSGSVSVSGGRLAMAATGNNQTNTYNNWDMIGTSISAKVTPPSDWDTDQFTAYMSVMRTDQSTMTPPGGSQAPFEMGIERPGGEAHNKLVLGSEQGGGVQIDYDPVAHAYWRLREASGVYYHDTSPDGVTWTNRRSQAYSGLSPTAMRLYLHNTNPGAGTAGPTYFDKVNIVPMASPITLAAVWYVNPTTTQVSQSLTATWTVVSRVATSLTAAWQTRALVSNTLTAVWQARALVSPTSLPASWEVRQLASQTLSAAWAVGAVVGAQLAAAWVDRAEVAQSLSAAWEVRTAVLSSLNTSWVDRAEVAQTLAAAWSVGARVTANLTAAWAVREVVIVQLLTDWLVEALTSVAAGLTATWQVRRTVSANLSTAWGVRTVVAASLVASWSVKAVAGQSLAASWQVRASIAVTLAATWQTQMQVSTSLSAVWTDRETATQTLLVYWFVRRTQVNNLPPIGTATVRLGEDHDVRLPGYSGLVRIPGG